jgi:hypothetical protein
MIEKVFASPVVDFGLTPLYGVKFNKISPKFTTGQVF